MRSDSACNGKDWPVVDMGHPAWEQWVTKYELQARLDGGKSWTSLGVLKGNTDMISEVAHDLRELCHNTAGLQCRYLRFIPQSCHGQPAMRIGVYGTSTEKQGAPQAKKKEEERIRYLIPVPLTHRNRRRRQRDGENRRNHSPEWRGKYGGDWQISRRRKLRAEVTRREAQEATGGGSRTLLRRQDSAAYESDAEVSTEKVDGQLDRPDTESLETLEAPPAPRPPRLQRANSRRVEEALHERPMLQQTRTDEERGYCSEPEELLADGWLIL